MQSTGIPECTSPSQAKSLIAIEGWPYSISVDGQVYSHRSQKFLKSRAQNSGYQLVHLCLDGDRKGVTVHRLVAQAFVPNPGNKQEVNHKDGDKSNNHASNLEWSTHSENLSHAHKHRLHRSGAKLTDIQAVAMRRLMQYGMSSTQLSKLTGKSLSYLGHIKHGRMYRHATGEPV